MEKCRVLIIPVLLILLQTAILNFPVSGAQGSGSSLINLNPDPSGEPWIAGGVSYEEWSKEMQNISPLPLAKTRAVTAIKLPSKVDNSTNPEFRPVFNQKGGSCAQASGIGYLYTYEINVLRNLPSNTPENQYPYDFTYNFLNVGSGDTGSISTDGWNIVKSMGVPDVETYGGFGLAKYNQWVSGYDIYHEGMSNRLDGFFTMKIRTGDDILKMKQFLFDHSNGSAKGGLLNYSANFTNTKLVSLASGTPDAGKKAIIAFGNSGGHSMTIAGYNDSVRYDFNGDGRYTNDVDINGDNVVDVRDWEVGAAVMVNSWGTGWGNSGKAYLMYKVLAESNKNGGIWDNTLSGITISNANTTPQLTYKVKMSFNPRSAVKIRAGYSTIVSASSPSSNKSFNRAFNYSGGAFPMQGVNSDPLEFGLDVSDFLSKIGVSSAAFFLMIDSKSGSGTVQQFSLIDYTSGAPIEFKCTDQDVPVSAGAGATLLKIIRTVSSLVVTSPNGGEHWELNRPFNITWNSTDSAAVTIELLKAGAVLQTIASAVPNNGSYQWNIPSQLEPGNDYSIRIHSSNLSDVSNAAFSIEPASTLELVSPNNGEYLNKGQSAAIVWKSNAAGKLKIDLYRQGALYKNIDSADISDSTYLWTIPQNLSGGFDYRIRLTSKEKNWLFDECDKDLAIEYPVVKTPCEQTFDNFATGEALSGGWEQSVEDDFNWTVNKGPTPSKKSAQANGTGPDCDHSSGTGNYLYVEASPPNNPGKRAFLISPVFDIKNITGPRCDFWCHMYSKYNRMGKLWVDMNVNGIWRDSVLYLTGDHGDKWFSQEINLSSYNSDQVQVRFRVVTGSDYDGDVCIDDFVITDAQSLSRINGAKLVQPRFIITKDHVFLSECKGQVKIFTLRGTQIFNKTVATDKADLDVSNLSEGAYILKINEKVHHFVH